MAVRVKLIFNLAGRRSGKLRRETLEGRTHLVAPCVMLVEGVVSGSKGPLLYLNEENCKDTNAWNHMPVVVYHPKKDGVHVSARTPEVLNTSKIGLLLNTSGVDNKLCTEVWCDEEKTKEVDERVYNALVNEEPIEVSTGLDADLDETPGEWAGKKYSGIVRNHRPDHLAILPDQKGACSIADGGGIFANSATESVPETDELFQATAKIKAVGVQESKPKTAYRSVELVNEASLSDIQSAVCQALYTKFQKPGYSWNGWVQDVFDGYLIYYMDGKLWSVDFKMTDKQAEITSEPVEVVRTVQYKTVSGKIIGNSAAWNFITNEEKEMAAPTFDKKAHITGLIGNGWTEQDRPFLETLSDDKLAKIQPTTPTTPVPAAPALNPAAPAPIANAEVPTTLTPDQQKMFSRMIANERRQKDGLITRIVNAQTLLGLPAEKRFKPEFLANKEVEELEGWAATLEAQNTQVQQNNDPYAGMFQQQPNYGGAAGGPPIANQGNNSPFVCNEENPQMPQLDFSDWNTASRK